MNTCIIINDLSLFIQGVNLESDEKQRVITILKREAVTYAQLMSNITNEDLQDADAELLPAGWLSEGRDSGVLYARL